jgi:menaquinone-dependent protoporphyrinogen oxidase
MTDVLILYASTHGHTAKLAARIARVMRDDGASVDVHDVASAPDGVATGYRTFVLGGSIHGGHHQHELIAWAKRHAVTLNTRPSAFFSVCLTAADDSEESREATRGYLDDVEDETGWMPTTRTSFAGALQYREYDFATRLVMRLLMHRGGHPSDVSRDYDYTDWDAVDRFAHDCARIVTEAADVPQAAS